MSENTELFINVQIFCYFDDKKFRLIAKLYANTISLLSEGMFPLAWLA